MTAHSQALRAYGQASSSTRTPRGVEYEVFARITHRLVAAARKDRTRNFPEVVRAVHDNRQLWTILAADVAGEGNTLPQQLRAQIFYLAEFTFSHSRKVLNEKAELRPLIEVNTSIMRGLRAGGTPK
ncbi:MAG: flagellar biosynthesis regulator FlaF [Rhodobacteraceae bacterium]|nr:flagellar biosynthesis regulator FlaF [Paracoccaceae bacterium]MBR9821113.1 flagellar biosynthesis regulator FlaF [Paracoccaceae bacterium]